MMTVIIGSLAYALQKARSKRVENTSSRRLSQNMGGVAPFMNNAG